MVLTTLPSSALPLHRLLLRRSPLRRSLVRLALLLPILLTLLVAPSAPASAASVCDAMTSSMYSRMNPGLQTSLLTRSSAEATKASTTYGFSIDRGIPGLIATTPVTGLQPVRRLYDSARGDFLWTATQSAYDSAVAAGYTPQVTSFYASTSALGCTVPVYRYVKGNKHQFVSSALTSSLSANGWTNEGAAFHVKAGTAPTAIGSATTLSPGLPNGTSLQSHSGDLVIRTPGTVIDGYDIKGFLVIRAADVTIRRSIVRGGVATFHRGVIDNYGYPGLVIEDSTIQRSQPSVYLDGIKGSDFTLRRVKVVGGVDNVKVQGNNVRIEDSLLEGTDYFASDPSQRGGATHNDNIQVQKGNSLTIVRTTIRGGSNFGILLAATTGPTSSVVIRDNVIDGGYCSVKLEELNGQTLSSVTVSGNRFGRGQTWAGCAIHQTPGTSASYSDNSWIDTGSTVNPYVK